MGLVGVAPAARRHEGGTNGLELGIVEDADGALLDVDGVAGIDQGLGCGGGQGRAVLEGLVLGAQVEDGGSHGEAQ